MATRKTIIKLIWVALYTSPVISTLLITPVFMFNGNVHDWYVASLVFMTLGVLAMWAENIVIFIIANRLRPPAKYGYLTYVASYLLCVLVNLFLVAHLFHRFFNVDASTHSAMHFHFIFFVSVNTAILILQSLTLVRDKSAAVELENALLKMKNIEAANEQLRHQVQPHFLFNSLSTLKALIKSSPEKAEEYLVKLSEFLRYSVQAGGFNTTTLEKELQLCTDYLEMQKIRFGNALQYTIAINEHAREKFNVPVFAIQTLVENAVKHNSFTLQAPLKIDIAFNDKAITVSNNLQPKSPPENAAGTGLANLRERYRLMSGGDVVVEINNGLFNVSIKAFENENSDNRR